MPRTGAEQLTHAPPYNDLVNVSNLGEFPLIRRLTEAVGGGAPDDLLVGIGDDAAVWSVGGQPLIATTDTMVEGVHFLPGVAPWEDVGWKALAVNVSDIAAMGGTPLFALVTLALPPETPVDAVDALYAGLRECAAEYGVTIAGGDIVRAPQVTVTIALLGVAAEREGDPLLLRRGAARAGDAIAVTGALGASAAGLRRLREGAPAEDPLVRAHLRPRPPLAAAQQAARAGIGCGIDISDGLLQDLGHVCQMSGLGAELNAPAIPVSPEAARAYGEQALELACTGGEDYEMVFTAPSDTLGRLQSQVDVPLTIIGRMVPHERHAVRLLDDAGREITFETPGWDQLQTP